MKLKKWTECILEPWMELLYFVIYVVTVDTCFVKLFTFLWIFRGGDMPTTQKCRINENKTADIDKNINLDRLYIKK